MKPILIPQTPEPQRPAAPTAADHLHRLLTLEQEVLDLCELRETDAPASDPFEIVEQLLLAADEEGDILLVNRLVAALEFGKVLAQARALDVGDDEGLAKLVRLAQTHAALVSARPLEVVRG